ncbi:chloride channel protein [Leekyejoonella antrihumi]|uniref:CBS domain-containing protein n=1 Tax=Leekyejoonella antrihumi TaxID=1660198 RepID=A0A563E0Z7_9MICO|nr:chloride channel protein [Leekyejoonella antrihumi]TWP36065.1 CBS domain-containing protein [Leekyejoonella antrihumi]
MTAVIQTRLRSFGAGAGGWIRRTSYLKKWVVLGTAIGVIAGLGAVVFYMALQAAGHLLLDDIGGYVVPTPTGEGGAAGDGTHFSRWWAIPLVVALGGLISGFLVFKFAPEAEGHGTDAAIDAVHRNPRMIRMRAVVVKLITSAITIGSGGSGGREGPTAQISAGFGSLLARTLDLSPEEGRIAVSVGIGSGIGAIFGAPLGGAVLAADIVYKDDFETEALIPGLVTSIVAYTVFGFLESFHPMFGYAAPGYEFHEPIQLVWFAIIGIVAGGVGLLYSDTFYRVAAFSKSLRLSPIVKPAIGGLLVGLMALAIPQVLGTGYGWVQVSLNREGLLGIPLWAILLLPFARILATSLSIGSGGSGGIFGPGMVIGAFTGGAVWRVLETFAPGVPHSPAPFVIVGMMACFGAIARAPLAIMLMVAEMTGSLTILAPAMVAVGLAYLIVRHFDKTIYVSQLANREEARSARLKHGLPLLGRVQVVDAMSIPHLVLSDTLKVREAIEQLRSAGVPGAPVVDSRSQFVGTVDVHDLEALDAAESTLTRRADAAAATVPVDANLDQAIDAMPSTSHWITVLDEERQVQGILAFSDIVRAYHRGARSQARQMSRVSSNAGVAEVHVGEGSPLVGHTLREELLPDGVIVISVRREDGMMLGLGSVQMRVGDEVTVLVRPDMEDDVRKLFMGEEALDARPG